MEHSVYLMAGCSFFYIYIFSFLYSRIGFIMLLMSENLNYVGDGFEIKDGALVIFNAEEYFGVDEFCQCNGDVEECSFEEMDIVIPQGVISIGKGAFAGCSNLRSVVIPAGVLSIEAEAFKGCCNLSSVSFSDGQGECSGVKMIGRDAFLDCVSLQELILPHSVIFVGDGAFAGLKNLELLVSPEGLELSNTVWGDNFQNVENH